MHHELSKDSFQVAPAEDQDVIQALSACRSHPAFAEADLWVPEPDPT
jgi:hypothetical protein